MENINLPAEIILDIFSRLPTESVLQCRQVCKTWRTLLHHPCFAHMHLRRSLQLETVGLLYFSANGSYENQIHYGEYDENDEQSSKTLKWIKNPLAKTYHDVVGSCNGLICFSIHHGAIDDPIYICNPVSGEYMILPKLGTITIPKYSKEHIVSGFGHLPSTNEYKVVRIFYGHYRYEPEPSGWIGSIEVYTIGGGSGWRKKGEIMYSLSDYCILGNGALNWLDYKEMKIVAFDLANEEFYVLPSPPFVVPGENNFFQIRLLKGLLCAVRNKPGESVDIWSIKRKQSCTTYDMKEQEYQYCWNWHKEFSIAWEHLVKDNFELFAFTKSGGKVLLSYNQDDHDHIRNNLFRYDLKTSTSKELLSMNILFVKAIPHLNSFVSLKALGEEDAKMIGSAEGLVELEAFQPNWDNFFF